MGGGRVVWLTRRTVPCANASRSVPVTGHATTLSASVGFTMPVPEELVPHLLHLPLRDRHRLLCEAMAEQLEAGVSLLRDDPETCAALRAHAEVWRGRQANHQELPEQAGQLLQFRRPA